MGAGSREGGLAVLERNAFPLPFIVPPRQPRRQRSGRP
jgi:hypothetical protein